MYVILVNDDNTLTASKKERIMQKSKLFDTLWFLVNPKYKGYNMADCTVMMEYLLPVSKKYCSEILRLSKDRYEEYLKYLLPFDTNLTSEAGQIELQLTFVYSDLDVNGNSIQRVRKTSTAFINIIPISEWSNIIPDCALSAIDQRLIKTDAQIKALNDYAIMLDSDKADNLKYDVSKNTLQLLSNGKEIGSKVELDGYGSLLNGVPIVDINDKGQGGSGSGTSSGDNVVEF